MSRALAAAAVVLVGLGLVLLVQGPTVTTTTTAVPAGAPAPAAPSATSSSGPSSKATIPAPRAAQEQRSQPPERSPERERRWRPGTPQRIVVPTLGIQTVVVPVQAPGGTLTPPPDPAQVGWWSPGSRPGERSGSTLVAGHTVHSGGGALEDLEDLEPGARVVVETPRQRLRYIVGSVKTFGKGDLARDAERLFNQDSAPRLVLVTCEDWNGEEFLSNVVVTAWPANGTNRADTGRASR